MHILGCHYTLLGLPRQLPQQRFGTTGLRTHHLEALGTAPYLHTHARLDHAQVFVQRPAEIRQLRIAAEFKLELATGFGGLH
jgi:hypothetical protein